MKVGSSVGLVLDEIRLRNRADAYGAAYPESGAEPLFGHETYVVEFMLPTETGYTIRLRWIQVYLEDGRELLAEIRDGRISWLHW